MNITAVRRVLAGVALVASICYAGPASADILSFYPAAQTVALGAEATVDVRISGVLPEGLGAYDFDIVFDPLILAFDRAVDGLGLGFAIGLGTAPGPGTVTVSDFSLESVPDLLALQTDDRCSITTRPSEEA